MTPPPPRIKDLLYQRELGTGGFSTVHLYREQGTDRDVAVKVLSEHGLSGQVRDKFLSEARAMAKLGNHPNIVQVLRADETVDGRLYLVMQYYPNSDLGKVARAEPFTVEKVLEIGVQVASAVETAHAAGILHRDIKPANILLDEFDKPGLTDFGIAAQLAAADAEDDGLMSVPWSPPEVIQPVSGPKFPVAAEVYSLGATLWHLLVGHSPFFAPFGDNSRDAIERRILAGGPAVTGRAPRSLEDLLSRAMAISPERRPASVADFAQELLAVQQECGLKETPFVVKSDRVVVRERPDRVATDLTSTRMSKRPALAMPIFEVVPSRAVVHSGPPAPVSAPPLNNTVVRERPAPIVDEPPPPPRKKPWSTIAVAAAVVVVAIGIGFAILSGGDPVVPPRTSAAPGKGLPAQNAGGDNAPPGDPTVSAVRVDGNTLRFTWVYSAQQDSDTFTWRTQDGAVSGVVEAPTVDVPAPGPLCLQVKVVRADGGNAVVDWSEAGCGT